MAAVVPNPNAVTMRQLTMAVRRLQRRAERTWRLAERLTTELSELSEEMFELSNGSAEAALKKSARKDIIVLDTPQGSD